MFLTARAHRIGLPDAKLRQRKFYERRFVRIDLTCALANTGAIFGFCLSLRHENATGMPITLDQNESFSLIRSMEKMASEKWAPLNSI